MRGRVLMILASAVLAGGLLATDARARGVGVGGGHMGDFDGGHIGGFGHDHIGTFGGDQQEGLDEDHMEGSA